MVYTDRFPFIAILIGCTELECLVQFGWIILRLSKCNVQISEEQLVASLFDLAVTFLSYSSRL